MDFEALKQKAVELKNKAVEAGSKAVSAAGNKIAETSLVISKKEDIDKAIEKSKNTFFTNTETKIKKEYKKRSIIIFCAEKSEFFDELLYALPIMKTKAYSQNMNFDVAKSEIKGVDLKKYNVKNLPCLVVFENKIVYKVISGNENILKLVKNTNLDINKDIDEFVPISTDPLSDITIKKKVVKKQTKEKPVSKNKK